jgi:uncharacterized protein
MTQHPNRTQIEQHTREWLERAVIGLNLCPFAKAVHVKGQIHYAVSRAIDIESLLNDLSMEARDLVTSDDETRSTTLLIVPDFLGDFLDFNDFLDLADGLLETLKLDGTLQIASFHPQYQFADTTPDDITNYTNRAPYPTLHLLREDSVDVAVAAFPEAESIFAENMKTLTNLGHDGWAKLNIASVIAS